MELVTEATTRLSAGGRIVIPARLRKEVGLREGDEVIIQVEDGVLRVMSRAQAREWALAEVRKYIPEGANLVDELIRERREEAASE
jgi:AbrB family looped-hinge helix DNA binding protein